jgi:hypothetical protein
MESGLRQREVLCWPRKSVGCEGETKKVNAKRKSSAVTTNCIMHTYLIQWLQ